MGDPVVNLREEDVQRIGEYVKPWLREVVEQVVPRSALTAIDQQLLERMVRVEEELKSQRELMEVKFDAVDRRFQAVDARFEAMDKRFEELIHHMDKRFESTDRRFEAMDKRFDDMHESFKRTQWLMGLGFVLVTVVVTVFGVLA